MKSFCIRALGRLERQARTLRLRLSTSVTAEANIARPNTTDEWERLYLTPIQPVSDLKSAVAKELVKLTSPGDVLLETGCGSGTLSAEIATAGRKIELSDFSQAILDRAGQLFALSKLPPPHLTLSDLTKPLPWSAGAVDTVWSSGVLEHWTDQELTPIVKEMARISRKSVISLVPYAGCVFYRWGKDVAEKRGTWKYGRELPRMTLRHLFEQAGLRDIQEYTVWPESGPSFLDLIDDTTQSQAREWWGSLPGDDPLRRQQGYLLLTIGHVR